jgi:hypothetical protein
MLIIKQRRRRQDRKYIEQKKKCPFMKINTGDKET